MVEKNLEKENEKLRIELEKTKCELENLQSKFENVQNDANTSISKLNEEIDDLEEEISLSNINYNPNAKKDYEYKTEKIYKYDYNNYVYTNKIFGWEKIKEFSYTNGEYRLTMRRDMNHPYYNVWTENERLFKILGELLYSFSIMKPKFDQLYITYQEMAQEDDYKLSGWRKIFPIRKKEERMKIKAAVDEVNRAYNIFKRETKDIYNYLKIQYDKNEFLKYLEKNEGKIHPDKSLLFFIIERYKFRYEQNEISIGIKSIKYNFKTKKLELFE